MTKEYAFIFSKDYYSALQTFFLNDSMIETKIQTHIIIIINVFKKNL